MTNTAERDTTVNGSGGAIYTNNSSPAFIECHFLDNESPTSGGARLHHFAPRNRLTTFYSEMK